MLVFLRSLMFCHSSFTYLASSLVLGAHFSTETKEWVAFRVSGCVLLPWPSLMCLRLLVACNFPFFVCLLPMAARCDRSGCSRSPNQSALADLSPKCVRMVGSLDCTLRIASLTLSERSFFHSSTNVPHSILSSNPCSSVMDLNACGSSWL